MEDFEKNINEDNENESFPVRLGDDDVFLLNNLEKYPEKFPTFDVVDENASLVDENLATSENIQIDEESQSTIWDNFDNLESPIFDEPKQDVSETNERELLNLDDEFKQFLSTELERSSKKKIQEELTNESTEFIPVEEKGQYEYIDLSKFSEQSDPQAKQEIKEHEIKPENTSKESIPPVTAKEEAKDEKQPDIEAKEKKRQHFPIWIIITAVAVVIFALATYFSYNSFRKSGSNNQITTTADSIAQTDTKQHKITQSLQTQPDTTQINEEQIEQIDTGSKAISQNNKPIIKERKPKSSEINSKPIVKDRKIIKEKQPKQNATELQNEKSTIQPKPEKTILAENRQKTKEASSVATSNIENAVYTIQVYSTPSREDAEQWKKKLESLNIPKAYISEQKIRDIIWYRVRFGEYPTKESAIQAAKQLGFSQMWIDRVK